VAARFSFLPRGLVVMLALHALPAPASAQSADGPATNADGRIDADGGIDANAAGEAAEAGQGAIDGPPSRPPDAAPPPDRRVVFRGRVLAKGTRAPLPEASLSVDGVAAGETGADGAFELRIAPGTHDLQIETNGYMPLGVRIDAAQVTGDQIFRLAPRDTGQRFETTVKAVRAEVPQVNLAAEEARTTPGTAGDPFRVVGSLPGVTQIAWPAAIYVVRGANPGNTGFFLDGIRVPALFHLALGPSAIHPFLIDGLDFFPGGYPANYGGYVSGIVAARTAAPPKDRRRFSADVTVYDAGGIATAPFSSGRGTVAAAARYSYTGALFSLLQSDAILRYGDYQLRVDHALGSGRATLFAFGSLDEMGWVDLNMPEGEKDYAALQFHRLDGRWQGPAAGGRLVAGVTFGVDWSQSRLFDRQIDVRALSAAPRLHFARDLGRAVGLEVGADGLAQDFDTQVPDFQMRQSDLGRPRKALSVGGYLTVQIRAGQRLVIAPGVRTDLFAEEGVKVVVPQPRLNVLVRLTDRLSLKLAGGRFAQMPSLPVSVPGFESFGLQSLGVQTGVGGSAGVEVGLPAALTLGLTGYRHHLRLTDIRNIDIVETDPSAPNYLVAREGRSTGLELMLRRADRGRLYGWLAYTLSWSTRADDNGVFGRSDWDQRHVANLVVGYRLGGGYTLGARIHVHTGRRAPIIGSFTGDYRQLPTYHQLDVRFARRFVFDRFILDAYVDVGNTTLRRDVVQLREPNPFEQPRVIVEDSFRIFLPTIGLHAEL
jgi:hypothetical protein